MKEIRPSARDRATLLSLIVLVLITLLALALRLFGLDAQSLWYDEAFSVYLARMGLAEITARTAADIQPPLYYTLLHGWIRLLGDSERSLRGLSLLFGVLTVPLAYAVACQLFARFQGKYRRLAGLLAALLVAVSPLHVWYGQEARMYTLLTFLCLLSSYLLLLAISTTVRGGRPWAALALWLGYALASVAALYTHYFALFVLGFQALYLFFVWWEAGLRPARLVLSGLASLLVALLVFLPWLPNLVTRYGADQSYWPGRLKISEALRDIVISYAGGESVYESTGILFAGGYALVLALCLAALVVQAVRLWLRDQDLATLDLQLAPSLALSGVEGPALPVLSGAEGSGVEGPALPVLSGAEGSGVEGPALPVLSGAEGSGVEGPARTHALTTGGGPARGEISVPAGDEAEAPASEGTEASAWSETEGPASEEPGAPAGSEAEEPASEPALSGAEGEPGGEAEGPVLPVLSGAEGSGAEGPAPNPRFYQVQSSTFTLTPRPFDHQPDRFTDPLPPLEPQSSTSAFHPPTSTVQYPIVFLLLYLLITPALILILSYSAPKFNPRYAMVAQPALALTIAGGLAVLFRTGASRLGNWVRWTLAGLALAYVLGVSAYATYNIYANPAFARADFRGVARYIGRHIGPDDTIILTSGHMFPAFDYYAPGAERHLLPDSPTLDTTRTLDYAITGELMEWLAGKEGVWVVRWQDEVVDPAGYLPALLGEVGQKQPLERSFSQVGLEYYRLPGGAEFPGSPAIDHPAVYNFGDRLQLLGYSQTGDQQVTLFWQALQPLDQDYRVSLVLRDTEGQSWGGWDGRPTSYYYPTDRWRVGQVVMGHYDLAPVPGTPPGDYGLEVGVYTEDDLAGLDLLDEAGAPQGKRAMLGGVRLAGSPASPEEIEAPHAGQANLGGGLTLLGWDLDRDEAQPGDPLRLTLVWSAESQPWGDYQAQVLVTDATGQTLDAGLFPPTVEGHPTSDWEAGQAWRGQFTVRLPIQAQPGPAELGVQLLGEGGEVLGPPAMLSPLEVRATDRLFTPPEPEISQPANLDGRIALAGADLDPDSVRPGEELSVVLYWKALAEMDAAYTVFVHLLGPDGRVAAGHDGEPAGGQRPTTGWVPGEYVVDAHPLPIPADLPPGEYAIEVGLYDAGLPNLPRLPVIGAGGRPASDHVILGTVQIP